MHRESLPIEQLIPWMQLNNVKLNDVILSQRENGSAITTQRHLPGQGQILLSVPPELILSLETVWLYAKSDGQLLQVLEAVGDFARVLLPSCSGCRFSN